MDEKSEMHSYEDVMTEEFKKKQKESNEQLTTELRELISGASADLVYRNWEGNEDKEDLVDKAMKRIECVRIFPFLFTSLLETLVK